MSMESYCQFFETLTDGHQPHPWQDRLGADPTCDNRLIRIPTGLGKTDGVLGAWLYHRVTRQDQAWPMRLIWCLPMRVLAEQTSLEAQKLIQKMGTDDDVQVHLLMGGEKTDNWHHHPEKPAIIVGTQDMLLSRALNRGYAASRARWPMDYGLLNHDSLWVMDEVQLMDVGLATSVQLQAFRKQYEDQQLRPCFTWWMSATLQDDWFNTADSASWLPSLVEHKLLVKNSEQTGQLWDIPKPLQIQSIPRKGDPKTKQLADLAWQTHQQQTEPTDTGKVTLVIVNRVDTACQLHAHLDKQSEKMDRKPEIRLIHSRFRGMERQAWTEDFLNKAHCQNPQTDMILIATQVVEAGVDISATALVTELAPWPSLVQRFGRAARYGGQAQVVVVNRQLADKDALPYDAAELEATAKAISELQDVGIASLETFESEMDQQQLQQLYPYDIKHLLTRRENNELFDTTADLNGADLDISRFIRSGEERDVTICWIDGPEDNRPENNFVPHRRSLCPVPVKKAQDWLFGKVHHRAWVWNYTEDRWQRARRDDCYPGQTLLVDKDAGGYEPTTGFNEKRKTTVQIDLEPPKNHSKDQLSDRAHEREDQSQFDWQSIATHGKEVADDLQTMAGCLTLAQPLTSLLDLAGRLHDWGKSHIAFQSSIVRQKDRPPQQDLAKAPKEAWCNLKDMYCNAEQSIGKRRGFRHELASTLAIFELLRSHNPDHAALLGQYHDLAEQLTELGVWDSQEENTSYEVDCPLAKELDALDAGQFNLLVYLVCSHHGKVRGSWQSTPLDQKYEPPSASSDDQSTNLQVKPRTTNVQKPILGILDHDVLPDIRLILKDGQTCQVPSVLLHLDLASIGLSVRYGDSWNHRVEQLKQTMGPFVLAYLESLMRAADIRISRQPHDKPDALVSMEGVHA